MTVVSSETVVPAPDVDTGASAPELDTAEESPDGTESGDPPPRVASEPTDSSPGGASPDGVTPGAGVRPLPPPPAPATWPRTDADATIDDPVPPKESLEFDDEWDLAVIEVDLDAGDEIVAFDSINPVPGPGVRHVAVTIDATYRGDRIAQPAFEFAMTNGEQVYVPSIPGCGILPESIFDVDEVGSGQSFTAQLCIPVDVAEAGPGLVLSFTPPGGVPRVFELSPTS